RRGGSTVSSVSICARANMAARSYSRMRAEVESDCEVSESKPTTVKPVSAVATIISSRLKPDWLLPGIAVPVLGHPGEDVDLNARSTAALGLKQQAEVGRGCAGVEQVALWSLQPSNVQAVREVEGRAPVVGDRCGAQFVFSRVDGDLYRRLEAVGALASGGP